MNNAINIRMALGKKGFPTPALLESASSMCLGAELSWEVSPTAPWVTGTNGANSAVRGFLALPSPALPWPWGDVLRGPGSAGGAV